MPRIFPGRYTAKRDEPFVVFLIGMRINRLWAVHKWIPTLMAMGPMLTTLFTNKNKGMMGAHAWIGWREVMVIQYWQSFDDLEKFARAPADPHLPAWKRFNKTVGSDGSVGIWHETYKVSAGEFECVYGNMPRMGLALATEHVKAVGNRETARLRIGERTNRQSPRLRPRMRLSKASGYRLLKRCPIFSRLVFKYSSA